MNIYKADLHIHTILSPCASLYMSPKNIVKNAAQKGIDILGITDHNSTRQTHLVEVLAKKEGIFILKGAEITSKEEAHCLAFMPDDDALNKLQSYLDEHLPDIKNDTGKFGYQVVVDKDEQIIYQESRLLISAINQTVEQIEQFVHQLNGIFIPAHINRTRYSIISQLGFVPPDLNVDALELSRHIEVEEFLQEAAYLKEYSFISSSDAHTPEDIGKTFTTLKMKSRTFKEIKQALQNID